MVGLTSTGEFVAPVTGSIETVSPTNRAYGIKTASSVEFFWCTSTSTQGDARQRLRVLRPANDKHMDIRI